MKKEYFCIDCGAKLSNYRAKRCKPCYGAYLSRKLMVENIRAERSITLKNALEGKKYTLSQKQLDNMAKGRKMLPKGYNGYFKVKFKADQDILDRAKAFIDTQSFIFKSKSVYHHLISFKDEYTQNRLTHNAIQSILMKLGYTPLRFKGRSYGLWYKKGSKSGNYALIKKVQNFLMSEFDVDNTQAKHLVNIISRENKTEKASI